MADWVQVSGLVTKGYGVASGQSGNPRFPEGTLRMQKPIFRELGLDLDAYFMGTINLSIAPHRYEVKNAKYTLRQVKWSPTAPAEDFSFFDCRLLRRGGEKISGLVYYPHPETKPEHFQSPDILEVLLPFIRDLKYGDNILLDVNNQQLGIRNDTE